MVKKLIYVPLNDIDEHIGETVITEGIIEVIYPIKEDFLHHYIFLDSMSPVQRSIYMMMDTEKRRYIISGGNRSVYLLNAPLYFYEGQRIRLIAKVIRYRKGAALKFKKLL